MARQNRQIVENIKSLTQCDVQWDGDICVGLNFTGSYPFDGTLRHSKDKHKILSLIGKLHNLKYLNLRRNRLGKFDIELPNLTYLNLGSNYLGTIPKCIRKCTNLNYLHLGANDLANVPGWIAELPLKTLKLHKNLIYGIPELKGVRVLNLYRNKIKHIPDFVWNLDMVHFSWGISGDKELSSKIGNWTNLRWLSIVATKITHLPDEFCKLTKLEGARLHKNKITHLPDDFGNLTNLRQLTLYQNQLTELPSSFANLKLEKVNLGCNPLTQVDDL